MREYASLSLESLEELVRSMPKSRELFSIVSRKSFKDSSSYWDLKNFTKQSTNSDSELLRERSSFSRKKVFVF